MAPEESVEIRLVCKADYLDPQLKTKLHDIREKLKQLLHTGRKRFALKKIQPWNSVKVTFDIPKEAADRLRLLAIEGNIRLIDLGIISIEIAGQSNPVMVDKPSATNSSKELPLSSSIDSKSDDHRSKRVKIENDLNEQRSQSTYLNNNSYLPENDSWAGYKMKLNALHYYPSSPTQKYQTNLSPSRSNPTSIENS